MSGIKKIGVYGGTFDPPHRAHLKIIKESLFQLELDKLYVVVSGDPWMKGDRVVASKHQRQEMVESALRGYKKVCLLKFEINKESPSYSYQTLEYLKTLGNINDFYFIVGSDAAINMDKWEKPLNILNSSKCLLSECENESGFLISSTDWIGKLITADYIIAFQLTGLILLASLIGALDLLRIRMGKNDT